MTAEELGQKLAGNGYDASKIYLESEKAIHRSFVLPDCEGALFRVGRHLWQISVKDGQLTSHQQLTIPGS